MDRIFTNFQFKMSRKSVVIGLIVLTLAAALSFTAALPAAAGPEPPKGGAVMDGAKPPEQPAEAPGPDLMVAEPTPAAADNTKRIHVAAFRFSGELPVAEAELQQIAASQVGRDLTLSDLNQLAMELTHYLRGRGYLVATAFIPAQTISDGQVEITVVPGKYGAILINNQARIAAGRVEKMAGALKPGELVTRAALERVLLLLNDLPGIEVRGALAPGKDAGTTDLTINMSDIAKFTGSAYADNHGNRYTGTARGGFSTGIANLSHYGDALQIGGQQSSGDGLEGLNLGYNLPLGYRGARLAFDYSRIDYELGKDFAALDAGGDTAVAGLTLSYPWRRSRAGNLYGTIGYDYKDFCDELNGSATPKTDRIWKVGVNGNFTDRRRGVNQYAVIYYHGDLGIDNADAAVSDAENGNTAGRFSKLKLNYRRQQALSGQWSLTTGLSGQLSDGNLDSSEKFYLGGADGVRAYPQGEAASDQGCLLTVELKRPMAKWSNGENQFSLAGFGDYAYGQISKDLWKGVTGDNYRNLADFGLGLVWARRSFNLRLDYAAKLGGEDAKSDTDKHGRIWLQCVRYF